MPVIKLTHGDNFVKAFKLVKRDGKPTGFDERIKLMDERD